MSRELFFLIESSYNNSLSVYNNKETEKNKKIAVTKTRIQNFYNDTKQNPYTFLVNELRKKGKGVEITNRDLAYLRDLGVYPPNRMFILRRYDTDNIKGPDADLYSDGIYRNKRPVSKIIGWIPDDADELFDISVGENWGVSNENILELIGKILQEEFGFDAKKLMPVPGWSQALMLQFLNKSLGDNYDLSKIANYFGNPDVLSEGATRTNPRSFGLTSDMNFTLKAVYEAKYIGDIDPVDAIKSIINNALAMGSSPEVIFELGGTWNDKFTKLGSSDFNEQWKAFKDLIVNVIDGITEAITSITTNTQNVNKTENSQQVEQTQNSQTTGQTQSTEDSNGLSDTIKDGKAATKQTNFISKMLDIVDKALAGVFAVTIAKYRWDFRSTYGIHTGFNTTPWHLTIGNPLSPILSMNNIIVNRITIKGLNQFTFNDIPEFIEISIQVRQSRNMGTNRISEMFFRNHIRTYDSGEILLSTLSNKNAFVVNGEPKLTDKEKREAIEKSYDGLKKLDN